MIYIFSRSQDEAFAFVLKNNISRGDYRLFGNWFKTEGLRFIPNEDAVVVLSGVDDDTRSAIRRSAAISRFDLTGSGI